MSLEFAVDYPCALRARYSEQQLRQWGRLSHLHAIVTIADKTAQGQDKLEWIENSASQIELLQTETDPTKRAMETRLLAEEEAKQKQLSPCDKNETKAY